MTQACARQPRGQCLRWLVLGLAAPLLAQAAQTDLHTFICRGRIGEEPAGINLTVADFKTVVAAHFYLASKGIDIPLIGSNTGQTMALSDPEGGTFQLRLVSAGEQAPEPLAFDTSTGLAGTLIKDGQQLPTQFVCEDVREGANPSRWYADITTESDQQFEQRARLFLQGVLTGNRPQAADMVSWPLTVNAVRPYKIRTRRAFLRQWKTLFNPAARELLRQAIPHEMFKRDGMAMVANGAVWFDAKGAKVLNFP